MYEYIILSNAKGILSDENFKIPKEIELCFNQDIIEFRDINLPHGVFNQNSGESYILKTRYPLDKQIAQKLKRKAEKKGWDFHIKRLEEIA